MLSNAPAAVVRAELTKIRSLTSTAYTPAFAFLLSVAIAVLSSYTARRALDNNSDNISPDFHPVNSAFVGIQFGQLALVAFGVLLITGEYGSGMIRASLAAVPSRGLFYGGKLLAALAVALPVSLVTVFVAYPTAQFALGSYGVPLGEDESLRAVLGASLYLTLMCLFAVGVAAILRGTAITLTVLFAFLFVLSPVANLIPAIEDAARFLPDHAGMQAMTVGGSADPVIGPWAGLLIQAAWTAAVLLGGYRTVRRDDA
jgi:ABC-2 type transport system permease protein